MSDLSLYNVLMTLSHVDAAVAGWRYWCGMMLWLLTVIVAWDGRQGGNLLQ